jgi:Tol biopolymer transport system component
VANVWRVPLRPDTPATWADARQLTFDQAFIECADVDRSGTHLVLSSDRAGSLDVWTLPAAGGEMHQLTTDPSAEWCPNWSPDGSTVAFYAYRTGNREVWTVPAAGGAWRQITNNPGVDMHPGWSADGKELLFLSDRDGWTGTWATPVGGGEGRRLVDSQDARWSPVDRRIAYLERGRLWVAADDGRGPRVQLAASSAGSRPSWTPDGAGVIFRGGQDHPNIYIVNADGTGRERLVMDVSGRRGAVGSYGTPTDGKYIYFTWDEDLGDLWVMSADASR